MTTIDAKQNQRPSTSVESSAQPGTVAEPTAANASTEQPAEHGGRQGLEPTRYGDWEFKGRCIDF